MITGIVQSINATKDGQKWWVNLKDDQRSFLCENDTIQLVVPGTQITFRPEKSFGKEKPVIPFKEFNASAPETGGASIAQFPEPQGAPEIPFPGLDTGVAAQTNGSQRPRDDATDRLISNVVGHMAGAGGFSSPQNVVEWVKYLRDNL